MSLTASTLLFVLLPFAEAQKNPCPNQSSNYFRGIDLDTKQQLLVEEMLQAKRAMRKALAPQVTGFRDKWMVAYLQGNMSDQEILTDIEHQYNESEDERFEMRYKIVELLSSYNSKELTQVMVNIEENKQCHKANVTPPHVKKSKSKIKPLRFVLQDLNLSPEQKELLQNVRLLTLDYRQSSKDKFHLSKADLNKSMVNESIDRDQVISIYEERSNHVLEFKKQRAEQYMEFLDTFSKEQTQQFIENAQQLDKILINEATR